MLGTALVFEVFYRMSKIVTKTRLVVSNRCMFPGWNRATVCSIPFGHEASLFLTSMWGAAGAGDDVRSAERSVRRGQPSCMCCFEVTVASFHTRKWRICRSAKDRNNREPSTFPYEVSSLAGIMWLGWILSSVKPSDGRTCVWAAMWSDVS